MKCILSGLEIPEGQMNKEHYLPKSRVPYYISSNPYNIYPAIKIVNSIKGNLYPCEWEDIKFELVYHAYEKYNLKKADKKMLETVIEQMKPINPCKYCLASKCKEFCIGR